MPFSFAGRLRTDPVLALIAACAAVVSAQPFFAGADRLMFFQDDFYYYLQVARNLAASGRSTFDGSTLTNGYHPLWQFVLAVAWACGGERFVFLLVALLIFAGTLATYLLIRRILQGCGDALPMAIACWGALFYCTIARTGMEVILTVPLVLAFCHATIDGQYLLRPFKCFLIGLLASLVVLSRLDTTVFFAIFFVVVAAQRLNRSGVRALAFFVAGCFPVAIYGALNFYFFGIPGPVSGYAKHLQRGLHFSDATVSSLFSPPGLATLGFVAPALLLSTLGIFALCFRLKLWRSACFPTLAAGVLFADTYYLIQSFSSDWFIWPWYRYPLILSSVFGTMALAGFPKAAAHTFPWAKPAAAICCALLLASFVAGLRKPQQAKPVYMLARHLEQFAQTHPGRYAMGDAAGMPAFLMHQPVVQLEGLMMDKAFLANIRAQRPLFDVLRENRADYYVALNSERKDGCSFVREPRQAGHLSPHMTATFCGAPVLRFEESGYRVEVFDVHSWMAR